MCKNTQQSKSKRHSSFSAKKETGGIDSFSKIQKEQNTFFEVYFLTFEA